MQAKNTQIKFSIEKFISSNYDELSFIEILKLLKLENKKHSSFSSLFEILDIRPHLSLAFPTSDIQNFEKRDDRYLIETNFLSLYGSASPLPIFYTEDLLEEESDDKSLTRDFYDIFNERKYQQYFQAHLKYRLSNRIVEDGDNKALNILYNFIGESLGKENSNLQYFSKLELLRFANIFIHKNKSKEGLRCLINGLLGIKVEIVEFVKNYEKIPSEQICSVGVSNCLIDKDAHIGDRILNISGAFKIILSNLNDSSFAYFQKNNTGYKKLEEIIKIYVGKTFKWIIAYKTYNPPKISMQLGVNSQLVFNK